MVRSSDGKQISKSFDFLYVVPGVAIGLAIVRVCQFLGQIFVYKPLSEWSHFPSAWMVVWSIALLGYSAQYWFFTAKRRQRWDYSRNFGTYLCIMIMPILISFMSFILCPSFDEPGFKNLGAHFEAHSRLLYLLIGVSLLVAAGESRVIDEPISRLSYPSENWVRLIVGTTFVLLWFAPKQNEIDLSNVIVKIDREWGVFVMSLLLGGFRVAMTKWPI
jgi:hypothetical protein